MKRFLALAVAFSLVFGTAAVLPEDVGLAQQVSVSVSAKTSGDYSYAVQADGSVAITGYKGSSDTVRIPSSIAGKKVTAVDKNAFYNNQKVKKAVIAQGVKSIGAFAFYGCTSLTSVTIPSSVKTIGDSAFMGCKSLSALKLPSGLTSIGNSAFRSCKALKAVTLPSKLSKAGDNAFFGCSRIVSVKIPSSLKAIPDSMFAYCISLKSAVISSGVKTIGNSAFAYCNTLKTISIAKSVKTIGDSAFENCKSLSAVTIPSGVTAIGSSAFWDCSALSSVSLPSSVKKVGMLAFSNTKWLTLLREKNPVVVVKGLLLDAKLNTKQNFVIPSNVKIICDGALSGCDSIVALTVPKNVKSIGEYAFYNCNRLQKVRLAQGLTSINKYAFYNCDNLASVYIPDSVKSLGIAAFAYCRSLTGANTGKNVTKIADSLFEGCPGLTAVTLSEKVKNIGNSAFENCSSLQSIKVPEGLVVFGNRSFCGCSSLDRIYIPKSVTTVGSFAFADCKGITSVTVPDTVGFIGYRAFGYYNNETYKVKNFTVVCSDKCVGRDYAAMNGFKTALLPKSERISGADRFDTAVELSKKSFPNGAETVIVASGTEHADALAGVPLAAAYNAPILLCTKNNITDGTLNEIKRLKASNVIILGGPNAVSNDVSDKIKTTAGNVTRIQGKSRFETSVNVAEALAKKGTSDSIFFVYFNGYADALSASSVAAVKNAPVIYVTSKGELDKYTADYLKKNKKSFRNAYLIGGKNAISDQMKKEIEGCLGRKTTRISGSDRYDTCISVNTKFASVLNGSSLCVATGKNFPDALAGGVFAALKKAPLLLADNSLSPDQQEYLKTKNASEIYSFGGVKAVANEMLFFTAHYSAL